MNHHNDPSDTASTVPLADPLGGRVGDSLLRMRRGAERDHAERIGDRRYRLMGLERYRLSHIVIELALRGSGIWNRGRRNATAMRLVEQEVTIADLPTAFDGLRLLHLSDLHLDLDEAILLALVERVRSLQYDICVLTGDYRAWTVGPDEPALEAMGRLRPYLKGPVYGVLGNHDSIEMVPGLEAMDIQILLNESVVLNRDGEQLYLAGIDDPNRYATHNLEAATAGIPRRARALLLAHSPEPYRAAASLGFALMLCGHTHGGQICLPGGIALAAHTRAPRFTRKGAWRWREMHGYTSAGAGSSIVPARFNCPPEVTVHVLRRVPADAISGP